MNTAITNGQAIAMDADANGLTYLLVGPSETENGTVVMDSAGAFTYTADPDPR